jgi:WD40 repeat protein
MKAIIDQFPLLKNYPPISSENVKEIKQISWFGRGSIRQIAWSPNGNTLAVAACIGVWLYDFKELGEHPRLLQDATDDTRTISFCPDGGLLASGTSKSVLLWDLETKQQVTSLQTPQFNGIGKLVFSPDGSILAAIDRYSGHAQLWNLKLNTSHPLFEANRSYSNNFLEFRFNSDSSLIAFRNKGLDEIGFWSVTENKEVIVLNNIWHFAFGIDRSVFVTIKEDSKSHCKAVRASLEDIGLEPYIIPKKDFLRIIPDNKKKIVICASESNAYNCRTFIWDIEQDKEIVVLKDNRGFSGKIAISPDNSVVAYTASKHRIRLWDVTSQQICGTFQGHKWGPITQIAFHPHGLMLASSSDYDQTVRIWDLKASKQEAILDGYTSLITSVAFSPDGKNLALGQFGDKAQVWDIENKKRLFDMGERGHGSVGSICYDTDGKKIALGFSRMVHLFEARSGKKVQSFRVQKESRKSKGIEWLRGATVAFSPDSRILAASAYEGEVHLWELKTGNLFRILECGQSQLNSIAFSPDGEMLAVTLENIIQLWNWRTGLQKFVLQGYDPLGSSPNLAFSPDGKFLASAGGERGLAVRVWNLNSKEIQLDLEGHTRPVKGVIFNQSGTLLASWAYDHTARLWDIQRGKELLVLPHEADDIAFSPAGNLLVSTKRFYIFLWGVLNQTTP